LDNRLENAGTKVKSAGEGFEAFSLTPALTRSRPLAWPAAFVPLWRDKFLSPLPKRLKSPAGRGRLVGQIVSVFMSGVSGGLDFEVQYHFVSKKCLTSLDLVELALTWLDWKNFDE
jgi:hypothetical protein